MLYLGIDQHAVAARPHDVVPSRRDRALLQVIFRAQFRLPGLVLPGERPFLRLVEQLQAQAGHLLHRINSCGKDPVGHDLVGLLRQTVFQPTPPGNSQLGVDVHDVDPRRDGIPQIIVVGPRAAVQGQQDSRRCLDATDSLDIQTLPGIVVALPRAAKGTDWWLRPGVCAGRWRRCRPCPPRPSSSVSTIRQDSCAHLFGGQGLRKVICPEASTPCITWPLP